MHEPRRPQRSETDSWFRISIAVLITILIITLPWYAAGPMRIIFILLYLSILILVRVGVIRRRR